MITDKKPQILNCNIQFYFKWIVQTITLNCEIKHNLYVIYVMVCSIASVSSTISTKGRRECWTYNGRNPVRISSRNVSLNTIFILDLIIIIVVGANSDELSNTTSNQQLKITTNRTTNRTTNPWIALYSILRDSTKTCGLARVVQPSVKRSRPGRQMIECKSRFMDTFSVQWTV